MSKGGGWQIERLRRLATVLVSNVDKKSVTGEERVRLCNYTDVYYNDVITDGLPLMEATASTEQIQQFGLRAGDVLITKDSETPDDIGVPGFVPHSIDGALCGYHLAIVRARPDRLVPKYVFWALQASGSRAQLSSSAAGITRFGLRAGSIRDLEIPAPRLELQLRVAAFLDAETARIDSLIDKRKAMVELLEERRTVLVEEVFRKAARQHAVLPLKRAVRRIEVGIVVTPTIWYEDDGVMALRGINVRRGEIVLDAVVRISDEGHLFHHKSVLRAGDVVVVRTGQAGAAAVIPPELDGANCIDLLIVRPGAGLLPKFLEFVLNSDWSQKHIREYSVGTIQSHFNVGAMKALPVPLPTLEQQQRIVDDLTQTAGELDGLLSNTRRQIALLKERRQALITAAVTGELDITKGAA